MKLQNRAANVLERTSHYLKSGVLKEKPTWYNVVASYPPMTDLTKKPKLFDVNRQEDDITSKLFKKDSNSGFYRTGSSQYDRKQKNNNVSRIPKLEFLEDQLRDVFYHQHPWEFSRPKTLIENSGEEYKDHNWSHMLQLNKPLDGESVVQRTLWLLKESKSQEKPISLFEAYDTARFEFYRLRMEEELNSAISREESTMYGAVYESTHFQWGIKQEQEHIDSWAQIASERTKVKNANKDGRASKGSMSDESAQQTSQSIWETSFDINETADDPIRKSD